MDVSQPLPKNLTVPKGPSKRTGDGSSFENLQRRLQNKHIPALDGIRAVAVILVMLYHFGFEKIPGARGVLTFFVLSGFLITWILLGENERTGSISLSTFYRRRMLRLFPAFYFFWLLTMSALYVMAKPIPWENAWSAFFYVSNYYSGLNGHPANAFSHTWTLGVEEQFYLVWPLLFLLWRKDLKRMTIGLSALIVTIWVYRAILMLVFDVNRTYIRSAFETRADHLLTGCLIAIILKRGIWAGFWERLVRHSAMPLLTMAFLLASIQWGGRWIPEYRMIMFALEPLIIGVLIIQMVALSGHFGWRWLDSAPLRFIGRISYSLYLYQQIVLFPVRQALEAYPVWLQFVAAAGVTTLAATASYYLIERPFLRLKNKPETCPDQKYSSHPASGDVLLSEGVSQNADQNFVAGQPPCR